MQMTEKQYADYVKTITPASTTVKNTLVAFGVGGGLSAAGEAYKQALISADLPAKTASLTVSLTVIFLAALLTALHVYDNIGRFAGAGVMIPISGFANSMAAPAIEFRSEGMVAGVAGHIFQISGPVLLYGISAATLYGLILMLLDIIGLMPL